MSGGNRMRIGIIGSGKIAQVHGPLILRQPEAKIVGIADKEISLAKDLASKLKVKQVYQDPEKMIQEQKPDVVHVLVPPQYHAEISIMAMKNGCHVLVEKPMAHAVADAEQMIEAAKRYNVSLCVDQNGLLHDVIQRAMKLVSKGVIGDVVSVEAHEVYDASRNPSFIEEKAESSHWSYRLNGGPLQDMLPHPISLLLEYIPEITELHFVGLNRGVFPEGWDDEIRVLIRSDRVTGYINVSVSEKPDIELFTIKGTKGLIHADSYNDIVTVRRLNKLPRKFSRGLSGFQLSLQYLKGSFENVFKVATGRMDKSNGIERVISKFYESIRKGSEPPVTAEKGLRVVEVISRIWPDSKEDTK